MIGPAAFETFVVFKQTGKHHVTLVRNGKCLFNMVKLMLHLLLKCNQLAFYILLNTRDKLKGKIKSYLPLVIKYSLYFKFPERYYFTYYPSDNQFFYGSSV